MEDERIRELERIGFKQIDDRTFVKFREKFDIKLQISEDEELGFELESKMESDIVEEKYEFDRLKEVIQVRALFNKEKHKTLDEFRAGL